MASNVPTGDEVLTITIMDNFFIMVRRSISGGHTDYVTRIGRAGAIAVIPPFPKKTKGRSGSRKICHPTNYLGRYLRLTAL